MEQSSIEESGRLLQGGDSSARNAVENAMEEVSSEMM
jgi:hypothetical protein